jgi:hypothetical protein
MSEIKMACNGLSGCNPKICVMVNKSCSQCGNTNQNKVCCCSGCKVPVCGKCVLEPNPTGWLCKSCVAERVLVDE